METQNLQQRLISMIKDSLPASQSLVNELADLLEISSDSAYRRIRGETALTIEETARLCDHFRISFDSLKSLGSGAVTFLHQDMKKSQEGFLHYLENLHEDLKKLQKLPGAGITFAASDIPIFHHFRFPGLASFKVFYWLKSVLHIPELEDKKFDPGLLDPRITEIFPKIFDSYAAIPSIEIWSEGIFDSLLKQTRYFYEAGLFRSKEDILGIFELMNEELEHLRQETAVSAKFVKEPGRYENNFHLHISEIEVGNNTILTRRGENETVYLTYHTFKSLISSNAAFCTETRNWLEYLTKKSILISGVAEKQRFIFFNLLSEKCRKLKESMGIG
jgi:hypothetical protein